MTRNAPKRARVKKCNFPSSKRLSGISLLLTHSLISLSFNKNRMKAKSLTPLLLFFLMGAFSTPTASAQSIWTPKVGTKERTAICDGMRIHVRNYNGAENYNRKLLFIVKRMAVKGNYCHFKGYPVHSDGSHVPREVFGDIVYDCFLKRNADSKWRVIHDLSRTDVPSKEEIRYIRGTFPKEIPRSLIPQFWRNLLKL